MLLFPRINSDYFQYEKRLVEKHSYFEGDSNHTVIHYFHRREIMTSYVTNALPSYRTSGSSPLGTINDIWSQMHRIFIPECLITVMFGSSLDHLVYLNCKETGKLVQIPMDTMISRLDVEVLRNQRGMPYQELLLKEIKKEFFLRYYEHYIHEVFKKREHLIIKFKPKYNLLKELFGEEEDMATLTSGLTGIASTNLVNFDIGAGSITFADSTSLYDANMTANIGWRGYNSAYITGGSIQDVLGSLEVGIENDYEIDDPSLKGLKLCHKDQISIEMPTGMGEAYLVVNGHHIRIKKSTREVKNRLLQDMKNRLKDAVKGPLIQTRGRPKFKIEGPEQKAIDTLRDMITEKEYRRYLRDGFILVKGKTTGNIYQVFRSHRERIRVYKDKIFLGKICIHTVDGVPPTDHVISMKIMIELDETNFLSMGNYYQNRIDLAVKQKQIEQVQENNILSLTDFYKKRMNQLGLVEAS